MCCSAENLHIATHCICMFHMIHQLKSNCFLTRRKPVGLGNGQGLGSVWDETEFHLRTPNLDDLTSSYGWCTGVKCWVVYLTNTQIVCSTVTVCNRDYFLTCLSEVQLMAFKLQNLVNNSVCVALTAVTVGHKMGRSHSGDWTVLGRWWGWQVPRKHSNILFGCSASHSVSHPSHSTFVGRYCYQNVQR